MVGRVERGEPTPRNTSAFRFPLSAFRSLPTAYSPSPLPAFLASRFQYSASPQFLRRSSATPRLCATPPAPPSAFRRAGGRGAGGWPGRTGRAAFRFPLSAFRFPLSAFSFPYARLTPPRFRLQRGEALRLHRGWSHDARDLAQPPRVAQTHWRKVGGIYAHLPRRPTLPQPEAETLAPAGAQSRSGPHQAFPHVACAAAEARI